MLDDFDAIRQFKLTARINDTNNFRPRNKNIFEA